ncbi:hypothetical protein J2741_001260 [Methanolinea mesophila]|uniref:DUF7288 family protein n=1 Tax=Methanolinea mesophila TaxID=547055 RepID=UPI001AE741C6|nr:hypothetical protein [Methanolinea mesophila]MBP1928713.1 hypothetical protein [Methanolinea mesophila]
MVNDIGQLYTIEGVAAGILMIVTAYLVISSTTVITPQDVHIIDMQLEQLGNDALAIMDTPDSWMDKSMLQTQIESSDPNRGALFAQNFSQIINSTTSGEWDSMKFNATITHRDVNGDLRTVNFYGPEYLREKAMKVSRWVTIDGSSIPGMRNENQVVLFEVLIWRG